MIEGTRRLQSPLQSPINNESIIKDREIENSSRRQLFEQCDDFLVGLTRACGGIERRAAGLVLRVEPRAFDR